MKYQFDEAKHAHLLDGSPLYGTSTVIKEVMPPFLAKWGAQCAVDYLREGLIAHAKAEAESHKDTAISVELFVEDVEKALQEAVSAWSKVRNKAATKGTDLHAELEKYVTECIEQGGTPIVSDSAQMYQVDMFSTWAIKNVDKFIASEVNTFSKNLWVGGIVDCIAKLKDGKYAVIDFKSAREAYFNHFAQAAGYALQLEESGYGNADGSNWKKLEDKILALIIVPFGAKTLKPEMIENVEGYKSVFEKLVGVYEFMNSFNKK